MAVFEYRGIVVASGKTKFAEAMLFTHRGLSGPAILPITLRAIWDLRAAVLSGRLAPVHLVAVGGVAGTADTLAAFAVGATAVQLGTALLHDLGQVLEEDVAAADEPQEEPGDRGVLPDDGLGHLTAHLVERGVERVEEVRREDVLGIAGLGCRLGGGRLSVHQLREAQDVDAAMTAQGGHGPSLGRPGRRPGNTVSAGADPV